MEPSPKPKKFYKRRDWKKITSPVKLGPSPTSKGAYIQYDGPDVDDKPTEPKADAKQEPEPKPKEPKPKEPAKSKTNSKSNTDSKPNAKPKAVSKSKTAVKEKDLKVIAENRTQAPPKPPPKPQTKPPIIAPPIVLQNEETEEDKKERERVNALKIKSEERNPAPPAPIKPSKKEPVEQTVEPVAQTVAPVAQTVEKPLEERFLKVNDNVIYREPSPGNAVKQKEATIKSINPDRTAIIMLNSDPTKETRVLLSDLHHVPIDPELQSSERFNVEKENINKKIKAFQNLKPVLETRSGNARVNENERGLVANAVLNTELNNPNLTTIPSQTLFNRAAAGDQYPVVEPTTINEGGKKTRKKRKTKKTRKPKRKYKKKTLRKKKYTRRR